MFIKLTTSGTELRININHIQSYHSSSEGGSYVNLTDNDDIRVLETPEHIDDLVAEAYDRLKSGITVNNRY